MTDAIGSDRALQKTLSGIGEVVVEGFGSSFNGFAGRGSDVDLCLMLFEYLDINQHSFLNQCLKPIRKLCREGEHPRLVNALRTPVIQYVDKETGLSCDVIVNNMLGVVNTKLIKKYAYFDERFHIIAFFIKQWAKGLGIVGADKGYLSSYAYLNLIVAYLQNCVSPPVLPNLQERWHQDHEVQHVSYVRADVSNAKARKSQSKEEQAMKVRYEVHKTDVFFEEDLDRAYERMLSKSGEENESGVA